MVLRIVLSAAPVWSNFCIFQCSFGKTCRKSFAAPPCLSKSTDEDGILSATESIDGTVPREIDSDKINDQRMIICYKKGGGSNLVRAIYLKYTWKAMLSWYGIFLVLSASIRITTLEDRGIYFTRQWLGQAAPTWTAKKYFGTLNKL